ncbi:WD repeat-containing protein [Coprinopsis marcescibilis]|uniref:WD repeat-containing protein n=1 Tax=Coprinopsis marcescibilis TaxID=230819 RepID=A0A5C3KST5_COPMA|nr:WD repeat-containing protein [Coprinopsis marcescibilis]
MDPLHPTEFSSLAYTKVPPSILRAQQLKKRHLSNTLKRTLDRVNVLGDGEGRYGHQGCVNAVNWAQEGSLLLTAGDDTTVRLWRMDPSTSEQQFPFVCRSVITTGHRANIFNVQMLPYSNRIATCAGDHQIRIFDATTPLEVRDGKETTFAARECTVRIIRCHTERVKKLVVEESPDVFLSLSEDATVRQHDLRTSHFCREGECPAPLLRMDHELSTLSMSPVAPYQFVVAGESPYGYLYDRRYIGRVLQREWGSVPRAGEGLTTCVRRFGRPPQPTNDSERSRSRDHITGSRISVTNGHEVILTYSQDKVYLFSTRDEPLGKDSVAAMTPATLPPNAKPRSKERSGKHTPTDRDSASSDNHDQHEHDEHDEEGEEDADAHEDSDENEEMGELFGFLRNYEDDSGNNAESVLPDVPLILPRSHYAGARNVDTVKDVNFLGPYDEFIVSGSDDGNWFMWDKTTGKLEGIYEGDESVVNVVEGHPHLPLVAVSGIDTTVKLFAPASGKSRFSKMDNANRIVEENERLSRRRVLRYNFGALLARAAMDAVAEAGSEGVPVSTIDCPTQ